MAAVSTLFPSLPAKHPDFLAYLASKPNTNPRSLLGPYNEFEAQLRAVFAQEPENPAIVDPHVNLVPVFAGHQDALKIHARDPEAESKADQEKYILPLKAADRRPNGSPATVPSLDEFKTNFGIFSEASLSELDWNNVIVAGSAVTTSLLPVPLDFAQSKRTKRQYYHDKVAPASDVDLFLYGLSEAEAINKIRQIERGIRDSVLHDTTTIRTKNAITIASTYPTRHVQIVLRIYKSISEILTGFDVDCSCAAYDGKQVYATPRALVAFMTQTNAIDLTRRSPSYESRLSKYARRGFEVHWPLLDRTRVDPTIFERSFARTQGLARLLVLEKLPEKSDRESYIQERRREHGRPQLISRIRHMPGNLKENAVDEVADWVQDDEISSYHTFTIPYGPKFTIKRIERLLYVKDLLLNAEWNKPRDRDVILHRHPAFFGNVSDVTGDCCGHCPAPRNEEEAKVAEEEAKVFISGNISFIKDNPGRQTIGSFNPITSDDWTAMAYTGNTAQLCEAIVAADLPFVESWCADEENDVNRRDLTGRAPLHLAVIASTPPIVQCLIDHGARLVARLVDGRTALHLAAQRGGPEGCAMIRSLCLKSEANAEEHESALKNRKRPDEHIQGKDRDDDDEDDEVEDDDDSSSGAHMETATEKSFVKVDAPKKESDNVVDDESQEGPDVYDINVLSWDQRASPLHLAIAAGHEDAIRELSESFGADILLPVRFIPSEKVILSLVLASRLPLERALKTIHTLLALGSTSAQADVVQATALHRIVASCKAELTQALIAHDKPAVLQAIKHYAFSYGGLYRPQATTPLITAIQKKNATIVETLLANGAPITHSFDEFFPPYFASHRMAAQQSSSDNKFVFYNAIEPPIVVAIQWESFEAADLLLKAGADLNTVTHDTLAFPLDRQTWKQGRFRGKTVLDVVRSALKQCRNYDPEADQTAYHGLFKAPDKLSPDQVYLGSLSKGSFLYWKMERDIRDSKKNHEEETQRRKDQSKNDTEGLEKKQSAVQATMQKLERLESILIQRGAKEYYDLFPDQERPTGDAEGNQRIRNRHRYLVDSFTPKSDYQVPDLNDVTTAGYDSLFEAAWVGDLDSIKSFCLRNWGSAEDQTPLKVSTRESKGLTPFSVALLRGHSQCASGILKICEAQYEEPEKDESKQRYQIGSVSDDSVDDDEEGEDDSEGIDVFAEVVDETYTVDILQSLSKRVKSHVKPIDLILETVSGSTLATFPFGGIARPNEPPHNDSSEERFTVGHRSLLLHAIETDKGALFDFLLRLEDGYRLDAGSAPTRGSEFYLQTALKHGRVEMMAKLITTLGAGLPLQSLLDESDASVPEPAPEYYQGLSVRGKKNKKWAKAHLQDHNNSNSAGSWFLPDPPLLHAIAESKFEAMTWLFGSEPERLYNHFAARHTNLDALKVLSKSRIGVEGEIRRWLSSRNELVFHFAVMALQSPETMEIAEYLIKHAPDKINTKSPEGGHAALQLCFALKHFDMAKMLIQAGADQTCRDNTGSNLLHTLLNGLNGCEEKLTPSLLRSFLSLVDGRVLSSFFTERQSAAHDQMSMTPLASWLNQRRTAGVEGSAERDNDVGILDVLLDMSPGNGEDLDMIDGAGDTPLHICARKSQDRLAERILAKRPDLLWRENATGRTPFEMARDMWTTEQFKTEPPDVFAGRLCATVDRPVHQFLERGDEHDLQGGPGRTFRAFERVAGAPENAGQKRRLASLFEANAVSDRLARREQEKRRRKDEEARELEDETSGGRRQRHRRRWENANVASEFGHWYARRRA